MMCKTKQKDNTVSDCSLNVIKSVVQQSSPVYPHRHFSQAFQNAAVLTGNLRINLCNSCA